MNMIIILNIIHRKYDELGRKIRELDVTCQKSKLNNLCGRYNYVI
jgi:hypothetical protein